MKTPAPLTVCLTLLGAAPVEGAESQRQIMVTARVVPIAHIDARSAPAELLVTAQDLQQGYIEVAEPTQLAISNNSPAGFALEIVPLLPIARVIQVRTAGHASDLSSEGGLLALRGQHGAALPVSLHFTLQLAPGIVPGRYPWPLQYQVRPL